MWSISVAKDCRLRSIAREQKLTAGIEPKTCQGVSHLNLFIQPKLKPCLQKVALVKTNNLLKY